MQQISLLFCLKFRVISTKFKFYVELLTVDMALVREDTWIGHCWPNADWFPPVVGPHLRAAAAAISSIAA